MKGFFMGLIWAYWLRLTEWLVGPVNIYPAVVDGKGKKIYPGYIEAKFK